MVIDSVALEKVLNTALALSQDELNKSGYRQDLQKLFIDIPSKGPSERYPWFGDVPAVKEFIGDKTAGSLKGYDFEIVNRNFYTAISVDKNELEDDRFGILKPRVQSMVQAIADHKLDLVAALIIAGTTGLAYDEIPFFSDVTGDRVNDNLLAGSGITLANLQTDLATVRSTMMKFVSDTGRIMGVTPDTIVCSADLEMVMLQAIHSNLAGAVGEEIHNPLQRWFKAVIPIPSLTDTDDWYAFCTSLAVRPLVYQSRKDPEGILDDTQVKRNRKYIYSAEMRGDAGYALPQLALKVVNSA